MRRLLLYTALALAPVTPIWAQSTNVPASEAASAISLTSAAALLDRQITTKDGQSAGRIEHVLLDGMTGHIAALTLRPETGSPADGQGRLVAVPWSSVNMEEGRSDTATLRITRAALDSAPLLTEAEIATLTSPMEFTRITSILVPPQEIRTPDPRAQTGRRNAMGTTSPGQITAGTANPYTETPDNIAPAIRQSQDPIPLVLLGRRSVKVLASPALVEPGDMRGVAVASADGRNLGTIERIMLDLEHGSAAYALLARGGSDSALVPVPFTALAWTPASNTFQLKAEASVLDQVNRIDRNRVPSQASEAELQRLYRQFDAEPYWTRG